MAFDGAPELSPIEITAAQLPHQEAFVQDRTSRFLGLVGGWGSAKTHSGILKGLDTAVINSPIPTLIVEPTIPMIRGALLPAIRELLVEWGVWRRTKWQKRDNNLIVPLNGVEAHLWLRSASDPDSLAGGNLGCAIVDEAGLDKIKRDAARQIRARLRHKKAKMRQFCAMGTPDQGRRGWLYDYFEGNPLKGSRLIRANSYDNPFLPPDYLEEMLAGMDELNRRRYIAGEFLDLHGRVYTHFDENLHFGRMPRELKTGGTRVMAADFGSRVIAWLFGHIVEVGDVDVLYVTGEQILENSSTIEASRKAVERLAHEYSEQYGERITPQDAARMTYAHGDPAGGDVMKSSVSDFQILEEFGFPTRYRPTHPRIKDRVNAVQMKLSKTNPVQVIIDPDACPYLCRCISLQAYDNRGRPEKGTNRDGLEGLDHAIDALGYLIEYRWPVSTALGNTQNWVI